MLSLYRHGRPAPHELGVSMDCLFLPLQGRLKAQLSISVMLATAGPHKSRLLNKLDPRVDSSTGTITVGGSAADRSSPRTGPAPATAGPHKSDIANRLDPRVDSELHHQAQYPLGTTTSVNNHPGFTASVTNPESSSCGPHSWKLLNKLDPRVNSKTGETTVKPMEETGAGAGQAQTNTSGVVQGSSTGAPAAPSSLTGTKAGDNAGNAPQTSRARYNPSTGTGFNPSSNGGSRGATSGSSTTSSGGSDLGRSIKSVAAGLHVC